MAGELTTPGSIGATVYVVLTSGGLFVTTSGALESYNAAHWVNYAIPCVDTNGIGMFVGNVPSGTPAGEYIASFYRRQPSTAAPSDAPAFSTGTLDWSGQAEIVPGTAVTAPPPSGEIKLTFPAPIPTTAQITRLVDANNNVPAGVTFPLAMTGPDSSGAFATVALAIPPATYTISYQSTLNGVTTAGVVTLGVGTAGNTQWDWATGTLQKLIDGSGVDNVNIVYDFDGVGPGIPNPNNPGGVSDVIAAAAQRTGYTVDSIMYDAVRGGEANVNAPFTNLAGTPLTQLPLTDETRRLVSEYSVQLNLYLACKHRDLQSSALPSDFSVKVNDAAEDATQWLSKVRNGEAGMLLGRSVTTGPTTSAGGALSVAVGPAVRYPGVPTPYAYGGVYSCG